MIPVFLINAIQEVKGQVLKGFIDIIIHHKDKNYLSDRESHLGHNYPKTSHSFGYG